MLIMRTLLILSLTAGAYLLGQSTARHVVKIDNARVKVSEVDYAPGVPRERSVRPTDEVIVFLDDCRYQRTDPVTGEKTIRTRKSGDVIWHSKGEDAPVLVNVGSRTYRTLLIELR
jgi:hypothetical protein